MTDNTTQCAKHPKYKGRYPTTRDCLGCQFVHAFFRIRELEAAERRRRAKEERERLAYY
jgi:hypothetical protein